MQLTRNCLYLVQVNLKNLHNSLSQEIYPLQTNDQFRRYNNLASHCKTINPTSDLLNLARVLPEPSNAQRMPKLKVFIPAGPMGDNESDYGVSLPFHHMSNFNNILSLLG